MPKTACPSSEARKRQRRILPIGSRGSEALPTPKSWTSASRAMRQCKSVVSSHLDCGALLKQPKETDRLPLLRSKLYLPIQWLSAENPSLLDFTIENKNSSLQSPIAWSPSRLSQSKKLFTPVINFGHFPTRRKQMQANQFKEMKPRSSGWSWH